MVASGTLLRQTAAKAASPVVAVARGPIVEEADLPRLSALRVQWQALAERAAEANVFHAPDFVLAAASALDLDRRLRAVLIWDEAGSSGGGLIGLVPYVSHWRWGLPITAGEALVHAYAPGTAPLLHRDRTGDAAAAFMDWLATDRRAPAAWLFRYLPGDGPARAALDAAARERGFASRGFASHTRAILNGTAPPPRKDTRRQRRRLEDRGRVAFARAEALEEVAPALDAFLVLEAAGWKGQRGTAAVQDTRIAGMFRAVVERLGAAGQCRIDTLTLDDRPIAVAISLGANGHWWLWKIAHDPDLAAFSPGVQLVGEITARALTAGEPYDSCAMPGTAMIERLWPGRRSFEDLLLVRNRRAAPALFALERGRRRAEDAARRLRIAMRGW